MPEVPLMFGFPSDPGGSVTLLNWQEPPFNRWSFQLLADHVRAAAVPLALAGDEESRFARVAVWRLNHKLRT